jgi:dTDP-4-dehydrorhamnose 3,5-epimerase
MNLIKTKIEDLVILEPAVFTDERGYFIESYNQQKINELLGNINFVQDNESKSTRGVLRGLHFQKPPFSQSKLVRCIEGEVLDVAVDLRRDSTTYGQYESIILSAENKKQFFVPQGFAHGFVVLSETALFAYKVDNYYSPKHDVGILWNDPTLNIDWKIETSEILVSEKDQKAVYLKQLDNPF